ncbi:MAG TPA: DsbE family thiol:disulfide interchange protein [Rhizomicrobium sp.]|jgi:cytochrome c biogenesis protein CcmG/thiol:disulfide interchange protein DsbE
MKRLVYFVPALIFVALAIMFFRSLSGPPPDQLPSALIDKPAPDVALPPLDASARAFATADLRAGHVTVLNVWASWCVPCRAEAPALAALAARKDFALYGLVYKDKPASARGYLGEVGNPFSRIDLDADGRAGIEWGIYGVPETFVIDGRGIVRFRYAGPIVGNALETEILPAIVRARFSG